MHAASSLVLGSQVRPTTIPVTPFPPPDPATPTVWSRLIPKLAGREDSPGKPSSPGGCVGRGVSGWGKMKRFAGSPSGPGGLSGQEREQRCMFHNGNATFQPSEIKHKIVAAVFLVEEQQKPSLTSCIPWDDSSFSQQVLVPQSYRN